MIGAALDRTNNKLRFLTTDSSGNLYVTFGKPNTQAIENIIIVNANTEYDYTFPIDTVGFFLHNRNKGLVKCSYTATESATKYLSIFPGQVYTEESRDLGGQKIYFQSPVANQVLEVVSWS